jgi:hypothetical protein
MECFLLVNIDLPGRRGIPLKGDSASGHSTDVQDSARGRFHLCPREADKISLGVNERAGVSLAYAAIRSMPVVPQREGDPECGLRLLFVRVLDTALRERSSRG